MKILIDCSLTGGRGPAKKTMELTKELDMKGIAYEVVTDSSFKPKLDDLGVEVSHVVNTSFAEPHSDIIEKFYNTIQGIDFDVMIKMGARMAGPLAAMKLGKSYIIADGGLPDYTTETEGLYQEAIFLNARSIYLTTQFDWVFPEKLEKANVKTCLYPISTETLELLEVLKSTSKEQLIEKISHKITHSKKVLDSELVVDLVMTGDYLDENNLDSYGGWLKTPLYDQCVGFVRRLVLGLGKSNRQIALFMDGTVQGAVQDLLQQYQNVQPISYRGGWDFEVELYMKALSDVTISRATNYQPYIAALEKGANVTTPVPASGYMDEDTAGYQYQNTRLTKLIEYSDPHYVQKLLQFCDNKTEHETIAETRRKNSFVKERNLCKLIIDDIQKLSS